MNERTDELIALAALGELTEADAAELDEAVAADPRLAAELADALTSAASLQSSAPVDPPARLRASVLDAIAGIAQDDVTQDDVTHDGVTQDEDSITPTGVTDAVVTPLQGTADGAPGVRRTRSPMRRRFAPLLAAAAVLVLVAGGVIISTNNSADDDPIAAVVEADDAQSRQVTGPLGELEFVYSARENAAVLVGESVDAAPEGATYQVWLVSDGTATSIGTFEPDADGAAEMFADGVDPTGSTIGITVEPAGGSDEPTLPLVAQSA